MVQNLGMVLLRFRFYNTAKYKDSVYGSKGSFIPAGYHPSVVLDSPSGVGSRKPRQLENACCSWGNTDYLSIASTADFDFGTKILQLKHMYTDELGSDHRCIFSTKYRF